MKILGIDPGLRTTGFGVIEKHGNKLSYIASGTIKTPDADLPQRLKTILLSVAEVIATYNPDCAAIEKVFVNVNPQSTLLLGQARGAAICALVGADLFVAEYTALQVKQAVVGQGKAQNAGLSLVGTAVASDAFFPFRDGLDVVVEAGATSVIHPGGSMRDQEVVDAADEHGIVMLLTGTRHFRH